MYSKSWIRLPRTLAGRLTFWYSSAFLALMLITLLGTYLAVGKLFDERMDEELEDDITELRELYQYEGLEGVLREINQDIQQEDPDNFFIRLVDTGVNTEVGTEGTVVAQSDLSRWAKLRAADSLLSNRLLSNTDDDTQFEAVVEVVTPSNPAHDARSAYGMIGPKLWVHLGESMEEKEEVMALLALVSTVIFCMVIPLGSFLGWMTARGAVLGIMEVSQAAVKIKDGAYDSRVNVTSGADEINELGATFNSMADRIQKLIDEMREMIDNIAHDLRSPLTRIRAISESTLSNDSATEECRKAASDTLEESDRLLKMINMTLDVAEAEANISHHKTEIVDLSSIAEGACELFGPLAENKNIRLSYTADPQCIIKGNKHNLQRMIANLLDNALKYTSEEGQVFVELRSEKEGASIKVADTGIGIPEAEKARVFDRFYRCDQSRNKEGCGLGLSFSRAVARAHGGDIMLRSEPYRSSVFIVNLPVQAKPTSSPNLLLTD